MPEAIAILLVAAAGVFIYVAARFQHLNQSKVDKAAEFARLKLHEAWLRERLERANQEQWGQTMTDGIARELQETAEQIDRATTSTRVP